MERGIWFLFLTDDLHTPYFQDRGLQLPGCGPLGIGKELLDARVLKCDHYLIEYEYEYTYILWLIL